MGQVVFDLIILGTLVIFTVRGAISGFVVEIAGIFSLLAAFWAARAWNGEVAGWLDFISDPSLRTIAACVLIFVAVMLLIGFIARLLKKIIAFSFAAWLDRIAGAVLGFVKGVLVWTLVVIVLEKLFYDSPFLKNSQALPYFDVIIDQIRSWLPPDLASRI